MRNSNDAKNLSKTAIELAICDFCNAGIQHDQNCPNDGIPIDLFTKVSSKETVKGNEGETKRKKFGLIIVDQSDSHTDVDVYNVENNSNSNNDLKLFYDLNLLVWDKEHLENKQNTYCYCGGIGEYHTKMLQCHSCLQWFHERCIKSFRFSQFYGDHYYLFICRICNAGYEMLSRIEMSLYDCVKITLNHLSLSEDIVYFSVANDILPFIKLNRNCFKLNFDLDSFTDSQMARHITDILTEVEGELTVSHSSKREKLWAMRMNVGHLFRPKLSSLKKRKLNNSFKLNRSSKAWDTTMSLKSAIENILLDHRYSVQLPSPLNISQSEIKDTLDSLTEDNNFVKQEIITDLNKEHPETNKKRSKVVAKYKLNKFILRRPRRKRKHVNIYIEDFTNEMSSNKPLSAQSEFPKYNEPEVNGPIIEHEAIEKKTNELVNHAHSSHNLMDIIDIGEKKEVSEFTIEYSQISEEPSKEENKAKVLVKDEVLIKDEDTSNVQTKTREDVECNIEYNKQLSEQPQKKRKKVEQFVKTKGVNNVTKTKKKKMIIETNDIDLKCSVNETINSVSKMIASKVEEDNETTIVEKSWKQKKPKMSVRKLPFAEIFITNTIPTTVDFNAENNPFYKEIDWKFSLIDELPQRATYSKNRNRRFNNETSNRYNHSYEVNKIHKNISESKVFQLNRDVRCNQIWIRGALANRRWLGRRIANQTQLDYLYESDRE